MLLINEGPKKNSPIFFKSFTKNLHSIENEEGNIISC